MFFVTSLKTFAFASLIALVASAPAAQSDVPVVTDTITWYGDLQLGGPNVTLSGTIEQIYSQILEANPAFVPEPIPDDIGSDASPAGSVLEKRQQNYNCNKYPSGIIAKSNLLSQVNYLYKVGGTCQGINPGCKRVSCDQSGGIFGCSRTGGTISVPCTRIADGASGILGRCSHYSAPDTVVSGRAAFARFFVDVHYQQC